LLILSILFKYEGREEEADLMKKEGRNEARKGMI